MNSTASQSSNWGCVGASPWVPKSSAVATMPRPKYSCQMRLTMTRATVGLFRSTSHWARVRRLSGASLGSGFKMDGTPGVTSGPSFCQSPRLKMCVCARLGAGLQDERGRRFRPFGLLLVDFLVGIVKTAVRQPVKAEQFALLRLGPFFGWNGQQLAGVAAQRIGMQRLLSSGGGEAEATEAVFPAVGLRHLKGQPRSTGKSHRVPGLEDRLMADIAAARQIIDAPASLFVDIGGDCVRHRKSVLRIVRGGMLQRDGVGFAARIRGGGHLKFRQIRNSHWPRGRGR